ncbi:asparaginase [Desulfovibrio sp. OttesenSCG-928-O18]|nr:asparaginase [Desulfovibrio sp. OttesenSCG-928-O18]
MSGKVVVFTTGGTIAMRFDPERGGAVPAVSGEELLAAVPPLAEVCPVEVREFSNIPSPHMTPAIMFDLAHKVERALAEPDVLGVVITHGTDTMEETAYMLDLFIDGDKPVCLTGAMRSAAEISPDGPGNILRAVRCAASSAARGTGTLVVMNEEIHAAREVCKTHAANPKTFASPFWGPLGYVDEDRIIFRRAPLGQQKIRPAAIVDDVHLLKLAAGTDDFLITCLVEKGVKGIVVEGTGRGNVSPAFFPGMEKAVRAGIPVVITTRCAGGRALDVYAYEGGVCRQRDAGVILGGEISGQKARIKLMLALGVTSDHKRLASYFAIP